MKKALVIGINNYPTSPLKGCVNDASAFASIIEKHGEGSPNFSILLKTDIKDKSELRSLIVDLFKGNDDIALLYFSGHGFLNEFGGYIVTPDYKKYDEGISMDEVLKIANGSKVKDKIIILDCCHSGAFGSPAILGGTTSHIVEGVTILTASRDIESAVEINGHGLFTNLLLDALSGGAADLRGHITPGGVYAYVDQALGPWEQRPVFKTNVTRFTSLRMIKPPVALEILRKIIEYFPTPQQEYPLNPTYEYTNEDIAIDGNIAILKNLQKFESVGLVTPVGEEHMYWAAQNSKSCKLTALGYHYWRLVKEKRI
jgi:hypothetical protein